MLLLFGGGLSLASAFGTTGLDVWIGERLAGMGSPPPVVAIGAVVALINLMTGMLRPDSGRILLGQEDITRLEPQDRVKRGLVRTFQINSLFPDLTALESVMLAVCERRADAPVWWRG